MKARAQPALPGPPWGFIFPGQESQPPRGSEAEAQGRFETILLKHIYIYIYILIYVYM